MNTRRSRSGFLISLVCLVFLIRILLNEDDPFYLFDNVVPFVAGFSKMSSTVAKFCRWVLNSGAAIQNWSVKILDSLIVSGAGSLLDAIWDLINPMNWYTPVIK